MRIRLAFVAAVAVLAAFASATASAPAATASAHSSSNVFPGRASCNITDFWVGFQSVFVFSPPQVTVYTRSKNGSWNIVLWYRYTSGIYQYRFAPGCTSGHSVRTIKTVGVNQLGHAGTGPYGVHCKFSKPLEVQQGWAAGASVVYLANGHTLQGQVRATFTTKKTQLSWNTNVCKLTNTKLPSPSLFG